MGKLLLGTYNPRVNYPGETGNVEFPYIMQRKISPVTRRYRGLAIATISAK